MEGKRQKNQVELAFTAEKRGEAPKPVVQGTEPSAVKTETESPASTEKLMEEVCQRDNLLMALKRVEANKGSPGIDGMTVNDLRGFLKKNWPTIREKLLSGAYEPKPVRRVEIPKPGGGVRKLGIPTVLDRLIQQAVLSVLQWRWDPTFSENSYGFRPNRSQRQAVTKAQQYIAEGYRWVVDLDLEKFFDRVNHDMLMGRVAKRIADKRLLRLIRAFLNAGTVMEDGLVSPTGEGTPQCGPLSPLLSNLMLDDWDRELERRGLRFVRYADDCNVYVKSERAGKRVKASLTQFLRAKLKLKVNEEKSAVARPEDRKFLGFSFTAEEVPRRRVAPQTLERLKARIRKLTRRSGGRSLAQVIAPLATYLIGWRNYFGFCETPSLLDRLDKWIRRRLRSLVWRQWQTGRKRFAELVRRGVNRALAARTAGSAHAHWRVSRSPALSYALPNALFSSLGLPTLASG